MVRSSLAAAAGLLVAGACATIPTKIPILGEPSAAVGLAGEWQGTYSSSETGRSGDIRFTLRAGADTAQGDIVMIPASVNETGSSPDQSFRTNPTVLTIKFVATNGDEILGRLDPYPDPVCGCALTTTFRGVVRGDAIVGTFTSNGDGFHHLPASGQWKVTRVRKTP